MDKRDGNMPPRVDASPSAESGGAPDKRVETREGRRERHRREAFERMVRVAREILFSKEIDDIRVADITEAADVGKGTFFNYFESKEDIVTGLVSSSLDPAVIDRIRTGDQTPLDVLKDVWRAYLCPPTGDWLTYEGNLIRALVNDNVRARFAARYAANAENYELLMRIGQERGSIRRDLSAKEAGELVDIYVHGLTIRLWLKGTVPSPELVDQAINPLERVLRPPAQASARSLSNGRVAKRRTRRAARPRRIRRR